MKNVRHARCLRRCSERRNEALQVGQIKGSPSSDMLSQRRSALHQLHNRDKKGVEKAIVEEEVP